MKSQNETILLQDPEVKPTEEVIKEAVGNDLFLIYKQLNILLEEFGLDPQWRHYKDGKAWLCKVVFKKKTVPTISIIIPGL